MLLNAFTLVCLAFTSSAMFVAPDSQVVDHHLLARSQNYEDFYRTGLGSHQYDTSDKSSHEQHGSNYHHGPGGSDYEGQESDASHRKGSLANHQHDHDEEYLPSEHQRYSLSVEHDESHDHNQDLSSNSIEEVTVDKIIQPAEDDLSDNTAVAPPQIPSSSASEATPTETPCTKAIDLKLKLLSDSTVTACAL